MLPSVFLVVWFYLPGMLRAVFSTADMFLSCMRYPRDKTKETDYDKIFNQQNPAGAVLCDPCNFCVFIQALTCLCIPKMTALLISLLYIPIGGMYFLSYLIHRGTWSYNTKLKRYFFIYSYIIIRRIKWAQYYSLFFSR